MHGVALTKTVKAFTTDEVEKNRLGNITVQHLPFFPIGATFVRMACSFLANEATGCLLQSHGPGLHLGLIPYRKALFLRNNQLLQQSQYLIQDTITLQ